MARRPGCRQLFPTALRRRFTGIRFPPGARIVTTMLINDLVDTASIAPMRSGSPKDVGVTPIDAVRTLCHAPVSR